MTRERLWLGARLMAPLAPSSVLDGILFGALAVASGMTPGVAIVLSATAFSGSAQYATLAIFREHGGVGAAILAAAALNVRYLAISATAVANSTASRWRRAASCLLLTDESWAVTSHLEDSGDSLVGAGLVDWSTWTVGTAVGTLVGVHIGTSNRFGLDAAFPAIFAWLLLSGKPWRSAAAAAIVGALVAVALVPISPPGVPVLGAGIVAIVWGLFQ